MAILGSVKTAFMDHSLYFTSLCRSCLAVSFNGRMHTFRSRLTKSHPSPALKVLPMYVVADACQVECVPPDGCLLTHPIHLLLVPCTDICKAGCMFTLSCLAYALDLSTPSIAGIRQRSISCAMERLPHNAITSSCSACRCATAATQS